MGTISIIMKTAICQLLPLPTKLCSKSLQVNNWRVGAHELLLYTLRKYFKKHDKICNAVKAKYNPQIDSTSNQKYITFYSKPYAYSSCVEESFQRLSM